MGDQKIFLEVDQDLRRIGKSDSLPPCPYGVDCYRKNVQHLAQYSHPKKGNLSLKVNTNSDISTPPTVLSKKIGNGKDLTIRHFFKPRPKAATDESKDAQQKATKCEKMVQVCDKQKEDCDQSPRSSTSTSHRISGVKRKLNSDDMKTQQENKLNRVSESFTQFNSLKSSNSSSKLSNSSFSTKIERSVKEWNELIKRIFLVEMPLDFFQFWEFCKDTLPSKPQDTLLQTLDLKLVGPFEVLTGAIKEPSKDNNHQSDSQQDSDQTGDDSILTHWRFRYDPPEFQTFAINRLVNSGDLYHLGYFRDTPDEKAPVVVANDANKSCEIHGIADNIFAAVKMMLLRKKEKSSSKDNRPSSSQINLDRMLAKLNTYAAKHNIQLNSVTKIKQRRKKVNAPTFHKFGIVVPMVGEVGYRPLPISDKELEKLLTKITNLANDDERRKCSAMVQVHQIMTNINYANDEKDFGMGYEFGIDLFSTGHPFFHRSCEHLLKQAYEFLERHEFSRIIVAHMRRRITNGSLSTL